MTDVMGITGPGAHRSFDTAQIATFRRWIEANPSALSTVKQFVQFRIVIDANIVIRDLIRLAKFPERGNTAVQELIRSTVVEVYAPRWLETELVSAIPQAAKRRRLKEDCLWKVWSSYKDLLRWDETLAEPRKELEETGDPKDGPYVVLERTIGAIGVLSDDRHIEKMGAKRLTFDFVLSLRSYARASVIDVGIRVSGVMVGTIAFNLLRSLFAAIAKTINRVPPVLKLLFVIGGVIALLHPPTRTWIAERCRWLGTNISTAWSELLPVIAKLAETAQAKRTEAEQKLTEAIEPSTASSPT